MRRLFEQICPNTFKLITENNADNQNIVCPFCNEAGFDLRGLKSHFVHGDCEVYNNTEETQRLFEGRGVSWIADKNRGSYNEKFNSADKQYSLVRIDVPGGFNIWQILMAADGSYVESSESVGNSMSASQAVRWANSILYK